MDLSQIDVQRYLDMGVELVIGYTPKLLLAIFTFIVGWILIKQITKGLKKIFTHQKLEPSLAGFLYSLISIGLKVVLFITVAGMVGVQMTSFIAILGAAGLAIGLALQGSLSNFAGGMLILFFKPFKVNDYIVTSEGEGYVKQIQIFNTILRTRDDRYLILPNATVSNNAVDNYSALPERRVHVDVGVSYRADIDQVRTILEKIMDDLKIPDHPGKCVLVDELGDNAIIMRCRFWMPAEKSFKIRYAINEAAKKAFDKEGIGIPFPQRDVHHYYPEGK
jgi:small conductance mechanosensitive channel